MTAKQAERAVAWFKRAYLLQDWRFSLFLQDDAPAWYADKDALVVAGVNDFDIEDKTAKVWVSGKHCKDERFDVLATLFHELAHILLEDAGINSTAAEAVHRIVDRLGIVSAAAYRGKERVK